MLEFGVLGPLEVRRDGVPVDLGGPRQRALLALLLIRHGEPIGADALIQALWGEEAPPTAAKALQVAVSRLRHALGPDADRLETTGGGYRLVVEPGELDAERFEGLRATSPRDALALWRGPALADLRYETALRLEIRRLEELRAATVEDRVQTDLDRGEHADLAGELEALVAEHPLRERLRAQQLLALYRAGRHADALAAYRDARAALDEQGLEPGPELRRLEQAILTHDPSLAIERIEVPPAPPTPTFGRDDDVAAVVALLDEARLVTLTGPGGVGKTRLAIEVARAASGRFVPLAAAASADRIPALICDALRVSRVPGETDAEALDRALAQGPALLVLDNLEHLPDAAPMLADLLDRHAGLRVLATSREPLRLRAERRYLVPPLGQDEGVALLADRARAHDPSFASDRDAMAAICELVGGLPLAIELAAARLGVLTPAALAERLGDALTVLDRGPRDAPARQRTMRSTLDWSFDLLEPAEKDAFTALGAFVGGCELDAAEAVTGAGIDVLESLVAKSLVTGKDGRLTMLEPIRQYAADRLAGRPDAAAIAARHLAHYTALAERTERSIWVRERACPEYAAMRREHDNLRAAVAWGLRAGEPRAALRLASALTDYMWFAEAQAEVRAWWESAWGAAGDDLPCRERARALWARSRTVDDVAERLELLRAALPAVRRLADDELLVRVLVDSALLRTIQNDRHAAREAAEQALAIARRTGDDALIGAALAELSQAMPGTAEAVEVARAATRHLSAAGAPLRIAQLLSYLGFAALAEAAYERAESLAREAIEVARAVEDAYTTAFVNGNLGVAALLAGNLQTAAAGFRAELDTGHRHRMPLFYFEALLGLSAIAAAAGDDRRAAALDAAAATLNIRPVWPAEEAIYGQIEERFLRPARARLGADKWAAEQRAGHAMTADEAVAYALQTALLPG